MSVEFNQKFFCLFVCGPDFSGCCIQLSSTMYDVYADDDNDYFIIIDQYWNFTIPKIIDQTKQKKIFFLVHYFYLKKFYLFKERKNSIFIDYQLNWTLKLFQTFSNKKKV